MPHLFGTDGVRGRAGEYPLDHATVARIGAALVRAMRPDVRPLRLIVGRDTRESGEWIEQELARGAGSVGATVTSAGVVPTPAIAYVTREMAFDAGIVISASHNPFQDNGIKVFSGHGREVHRSRWSAKSRRSSRRTAGRCRHRPRRTSRRLDVADAYLAHARLALPDPQRLGRFEIVVDTANGATTTVAPRLFSELGFDVHLLGANPDGRNINLDCGSTHPQALARAVRDSGARMGIAFDGDGDRAIFVDATGAVVDGDAVLLICGRQMKATGRLAGNTVVATVMSNIGLEIAFRASGIDLVRCPVGDKYVMEEMIKRELSLGGEQSGHVIFSDHLFTGDGIATAHERAAGDGRDRPRARRPRGGARHLSTGPASTSKSARRRTCSPFRQSRRRWIASRIALPARAGSSCGTPARSR